jgi:hypothetical protein
MFKNDFKVVNYLFLEMSVRFPIALLTLQQKQKIVKDLHLIEPDNKWGNKTERKTIDFFVIDSVRNDILLPYNYACRFFGRPHLNQRRKYHQVQKWSFKPDFQLFDYQEEVLKLAQEQYQSKGSTFINVFCSFGKTVVGAWTAKLFADSNGLLTLITFPRSILDKSWLGTFQALTNAKIHLVGLGPGAEVIPDDVQIILCQDSRIKRIPPEFLARVGHLVVDEADLYCTTGHVEGLLATEPLLITLLSATYERDDGMQVMLDLLVGDDRITRISKKPFFVLHYPTPFSPGEVRSTSRGIMYDSLVAEYDKIEERNLLICNLAIMNLNEKILILTYHIDHAHLLANALAVMVQPYGKTVALLAGGIKSYQDSDILVGTRSKIGVGFDEKEVAIGWHRPKEQGGQRRINVLILASIALKIEQIAGRVFRAPIPVIIDLVDNFKNNKTHWSERKKWYESRNGVINIVRDVYEASWMLAGPKIIEDYTNRVIRFHNHAASHPASTPSSSSPPPKNEMNHQAGLTTHDAHVQSVQAKLLAMSKK